MHFLINIIKLHILHFTCYNIHSIKSVMKSICINAESDHEAIKHIKKHILIYSLIKKFTRYKLILKIAYGDLNNKYGSLMDREKVRVYAYHMSGSVDPVHL